MGMIFLNSDLIKAGRAPETPLIGHERVHSLEKVFNKSCSTTSKTH